MLTAAVLFLSQAKEETETALKPTDRVGMNTHMRVCLLRGVVHAALEVSDLLWGDTENMQENHNLSEKTITEDRGLPLGARIISLATGLHQSRSPEKGRL